MSTPPDPDRPVHNRQTPDGRIADFLTGRLVRDTPREYVRQNVERALVKGYRYNPRDCETDFPIRVGSVRRRVQVAVFRPGTAHVQENILVLVQTSAPGTDRGREVEQLRGYLAACAGAKYGLWTDGDGRYCCTKRPNGRGGLTTDEIGDIPKRGPGGSTTQRPTKKDLLPATAEDLRLAFRRCHNYIAGTEGKQKTEAFEELQKLIACKIEDERSPELNFYVTAAERAGGTAAGSARARIEKLFLGTVVRKHASMFPPRTRTIDLRSAVVAFVVDQLQRFSLLASPVDVKGVAYEEIVGSNLRGDRGEFFTPRNACKMAVAMLDPQPGERLLDPACGTGGFLIAAMHHALSTIDRHQRACWADPSNGTEEERQELYRARAEYLAHRVFGLDLNPLLVRTAKMNMLMNNDGAARLWQANSLASPRTWSGDAAGHIPLASIDVLVANPPFGAGIVVDDVEILEQYELAARWDRGEDGNWVPRRDSAGRIVPQKRQSSEILFVERCVQLLRPGTGRFALIVPNGILNNPKLGYVRTWLMQNTEILAVVDMARELFQPQNDTQTSMVLARRFSRDERQAAQRETPDHPIFMAVAEKIGHDKRGTTLYRPDGTIDDDLPEVAEAYHRWQRERA